MGNFREYEYEEEHRMREEWERRAREDAARRRNLRITTWHGEGMSLFYVVDANAPEGEQPAVVETFRSIEEARAFVARVGTLRP